MMDVREKLVELLKTNVCPSPFMCDPACKYYGFGDCFPDRFADYLIAHGVMVQKWISVDDRLPEIPKGWAESPEPVLYMMKNTKTIYVGYYGEGGVWKDRYFRQYADSRNEVDADDVLCWMYQHDLPQPPKGE